MVVFSQKLNNSELLNAGRRSGGVGIPSGADIVCNNFILGIFFTKRGINTTSDTGFSSSHTDVEDPTVDL